MHMYMYMYVHVYILAEKSQENGTAGFLCQPAVLVEAACNKNIRWSPKVGSEIIKVYDKY